MIEPFAIEIETETTCSHLHVYPNPDKTSYDIFEDKSRLAMVFRDIENGGVWCSDDPIPMELINLIGSQIDLVETSLNK